MRRLLPLALLALALTGCADKPTPSPSTPPSKVGTTEISCTNGAHVSVVAGPETDFKALCDKKAEDMKKSGLVPVPDNPSGAPGPDGHTDHSHGETPTPQSS